MFVASDNLSLAMLSVFNRKLGNLCPSIAYNTTVRVA